MADLLLVISDADAQKLLASDANYLFSSYPWKVIYCNKEVKVHALRASQFERFEEYYVLKCNLYREHVVFNETVQ